MFVNSNVWIKPASDRSSATQNDSEARSVTGDESCTVRLRRLSDVLRELGLVEVQLQLFHEGAGPHYGRNLGMRIAALHRRLDDLERQLRVCASALGQDGQASLEELRQRLTAMDRQYDGPERRDPAREWGRAESPWQVAATSDTSY